MKSLQEYINESESKTDLSTNKVQPKTKDELKEIIKDTFEHKQYDLNFIDTNKITDMSKLFTNCKYDFDISDWDVSNVINMGYTFYKCNVFTAKGLENWDVSKVKNMNYMFYNCNNFNCDLSNWDISNVTRWKNMFGGCDKMPIPNWYKLYHKK